MTRLPGPEAPSTPAAGGEGGLRRLARGGLAPVAWVYGKAALWRRRRLERRARALPVPVISVGNITCGGTGKTPTAEMVARDLLERGRRPAFLSRGYGRGRTRGPGNDEFLVLAQNLPQVPHYQGPDRHAQGLNAVAAGADVLVLDDGFQHAGLERDLDLVLIDAICPFGGGRTLPAGLLREPIEVLRAADLLAITRSNQVEPVTLSTLSAYLRAAFPGIPQLFLETRPRFWTDLAGATAPSSDLEGRRVLAFCGIGNPESFRRQLLGLGVQIAGFFCFRDHHWYTGADLERLAGEARRLRVEEVVMTQKDAVKLPSAGPWQAESGARWGALRVESRIARGAEEYALALERALAGRAGRTAARPPPAPPEG